MNSPRPQGDMNLKSEVLRCCIVVQKVIEMQLSGENKEDKHLEEGEYGKFNVVEEILKGQVIDTTATNTEILNDNGEISRKIGTGPNVKSTKLPEEVKRIKKLQDFNNKKKLEANKESKEEDKEI